MAQHHLAASDLSGDLSDGTTCSCTESAVDKCSLRGCEMFQEPFFLHPPGPKPRDGIYINPMTTFMAESPPKPKDTESFYLHSPNDVVCTRITHLFGDPGTRDGIARKDETLTVKVEVHANHHHHHNNNNNNNNNNHNNNNNNSNHNNNNYNVINNNHRRNHKNKICKNNNSYSPVANGVSVIRSSLIKDTEHAYEQICLHPSESDSVTSSRKKLSDNASDSSNLRETDRHYSRSSSISESSNMSSETPAFSSSSTTTPSLSRNSSSERIDKQKLAGSSPERKTSTTMLADGDTEVKIITNGTSFVTPPPPPPPPPFDSEEILVISTKLLEVVDKDATAGKVADGEGKNEPENSTSANKNDATSSTEAEVDGASSQRDIVETKPQVNHLVNRHMVLPFIPPKFVNAADSNTLLKPSEYLKSICNSSGKNTLSKARSVDNLDIQSRQPEETSECSPEPTLLQAGPPPPPLPPLQKSSETQNSANSEPESPVRPHQPLATISIQDLTSVQLRRTNNKMHATKTFSAPPPRSVSMTNVSEPFFVQKIDLIAELKMSKDISGIKKLKVERAQEEKSQEQNLLSEINKSFNASKFVDQIPEKDATGNVIPIWKRQMLARKAAERAKKELEEQIARENEEKRQKAIPAWKRQLLAKKEQPEDKKSPQSNANGTIVAPKIEVVPPPETKLEKNPETKSREMNGKEERADSEKKSDPNDSDDGQIIPWRAQLRKTNSKLNILD